MPSTVLGSPRAIKGELPGGYGPDNPPLCRASGGLYSHPGRTWLLYYKAPSLEPGNCPSKIKEGYREPTTAPDNVHPSGQCGTNERRGTLPLKPTFGYRNLLLKRGGMRDFV